MKTKIMMVAALFSLLGITSCRPCLLNNNDSAKDSTKITIEGVAYDSKLGAIVKKDDGTDVWIDMESWPEAHVGKRVKVTGVMITKSDLPVFEQKKGEPIKSGMPVPEGTDLKTASQRELLTNIQWELVK